MMFINPLKIRTQFNNTENRKNPNHYETTSFFNRSIFYVSHGGVAPDHLMVDHDLVLKPTVTPEDLLHPGPPGAPVAILQAALHSSIHLPKGQSLWLPSSLQSYTKKT